MNKYHRAVIELLESHGYTPEVNEEGDLLFFLPNNVVMVFSYSYGNMIKLNNIIFMVCHQMDINLLTDALEWELTSK